MKLQLFESKEKPGKYALVRLDGQIPPEVRVALDVIEKHSRLNYSEPNSKDEFFPILLKDTYAGVALRAYGAAARAGGDWPYGDEVMQLAARALDHPFCKRPD